MLESAIAAELDHVGVTFPGGLQALVDISTQIPAGQITALVGESGSGKTTLCRVLAGLQPPSAGTAAVFGQPVGSGGKPFHRTVQMLLQDAPGSLSPRMRVRGLLAEPIAIHRLDRATTTARMSDLLARLDLSPSVLDRYPHQLSGGQARRVAIVRALLLRPRLLIADEPTAGLDLSVQGELLNLLLDLHAEEGGAMLVCTHNLGVVRRLAARTIVMYLGQIVEQADTKHLFAAPAHPYTASLLSAHPAIDPAHRRTRIILRGEIPSPLTPPPACRFHTRCPQAQTRCRTEAPALRPHGAGQVRCHFPLT